MKKNYFIAGTYLVVYTLYIALTFILNIVKGTNFWIGLGFITVAFIFSTITAINFKNKDSKVFPRSVSLLGLTIAYIITTIYLNYKYAVSIKLGNKIIDLYSTYQFIIYEIVCFLVFIVIYTIIIVNKKHIEIVSNDVSINRDLKDSLLKEIKVMMNKIKVFDETKQLTKKLEKLAEDIRFSTINSQTELEISKLLEKLNNELENIIEIEADDYTSVDDIISKIESKLV